MNSDHETMSFLNFAELEPLEYVDIEYETTLNEGMFDRFLGVNVVHKFGGEEKVYKNFPMPIEMPKQQLVRQNPPPKSIMRDYSHLDYTFQQLVIDQTGLIS